ncbi:MAG: hypothetical protein MUP58_03540 [Candidatus Nanohaloarchaeota archaeon QJJ-9]|nr:hypothetical protein [Candidatus Nanohaloarchaeota archaeon QJJ-9]
MKQEKAEQLVEKAVENLEEYGIEVGKPEKIDVVPEGENFLASYEPRFDRLTVYNLETEEEKKVEILERELLRKYHHEEYVGERQVESEKNPKVNLRLSGNEKLNKGLKASPGKLEKTRIAPEKDVSKKEVVETLGNAFLQVYFYLRTEDKEVLTEAKKRLMKRNDYSSQKTADTIERIQKELKEVEGEEEHKIKFLLQKLQDKYLGHVGGNLV